MASARREISVSSNDVVSDAEHPVSRLAGDDRGAKFLRPRRFFTHCYRRLEVLMDIGALFAYGHSVARFALMRATFQEKTSKSGFRARSDAVVQNSLGAEKLRSI